METMTGVTVPGRCAGVPKAPGHNARFYNEPADVVVDVSIVALVHCHSCGMTRPMPIGEIDRPDSAEWVEVVFGPAVMAAHDVADEHSTGCPNAAIADQGFTRPEIEAARRYLQSGKPVTD